MANIIEKYKATQRRIRGCFDKYTAELCPICPKPCCRKPTRVAEFDVLLAESCGCSLPSANDGITELVQKGLDELMGCSAPDDDSVPCDYLAECGCQFPRDMRPFECVRYICPFMKQSMTPGDMRELRALMHRFGVVHRELLAAIKPRRR